MLRLISYLFPSFMPSNQVRTFVGPDPTKRLWHVIVKPTLLSGCWGILRAMNALLKWTTELTLGRMNIFRYSCCVVGQLVLSDAFGFVSNQLYECFRSLFSFSSLCYCGRLRLRFSNVQSRV